MPNNIFKRDMSEYTVTMLPTSNYIQQITKYISNRTGKSLEESSKIALEIINSSDKKDPEIEYRFRDNNGDRTMVTNTLTNYLKEVVANKEIITPTFTVLDHPSVKKSIHAEFLDINIKKRKSDKHNAFMYKQAGDKDRFLHYNTLQKVRKIFNNSLSGAYASKSTILYHPAAHSILTSITRSVASIGNSVSESVISGNKHFKDAEVTINYLISIITHVNMVTVDYVVNKYKLYLPTADEVMSMVLYSSRNYWKDLEKEKIIYATICKATPVERAAMLYTNDLHNLKKYNEVFVKDMLMRLSRRVETGSEDNIKDLYGAPEGITNLVHHICMEDVKGLSIEYDKMVGTPLLNILASTAKNIVTELQYYKALFRGLFTTDILPVSIANMKDMLREAIVLSDTDSTCGSYDSWVEWYYGHTRFSQEAVAIAATVMTINTQVIDHNIKVFAKNMNIENQLVELLKMKNEFFWSSFITANVSKHYYANTLIQEGNVFSEAELELKGVHFISSAGNQEVTKKAEEMMKEIHAKLTNSETLDPYEYLTRVADVERDLLSLIKEGNVNIFKTEKIKSFESYKSNVKEKSPYYNHMLWEDVFADKYGSPGEPEYMVLKIPTTLESKRLTLEYIDTIVDPVIKDKLLSALKRFGKETLGIIRVPLAIAGGNGIPPEIINAVDSRRMVTDSLNVMYLILESIGIFKKEDLLISEMGY